MLEHRTWVEISRSALLHNVTVARTEAPQALLIAVIKSNAYGHGATQVANIIESSVDWLAVDSYVEACELRSAGITKPILILGMMMPAEMQQAITKEFRFVIGSIAALKEVSHGLIHLKIETGTLRQGLREQEITEACDIIKSHNIGIDGITTHFADVEERDQTFAKEQMKRFNNAANIIENNLNKKLIKHAACSAAIMKHLATELGATRLGISLYGLWSSQSSQEATQQQLKPVLSWRTRIIQVKDAYKDETVGYDRTHTMEQDGRIAILPIGYYDGMDRRLGNHGTVLIQGIRCPIVGRICMNMCMVDVTDVPNAKRYDTVTIIGKDGQNTITADEFAQNIGTIHYEAVTRIAQHLPRIVTE